VPKPKTRVEDEQFVVERDPIVRLPSIVIFVIAASERQTVDYGEEFGGASA